jgi:hypothetical protein
VRYAASRFAKPTLGAGAPLGRRACAWAALGVWVLLVAASLSAGVSPASAEFIHGPAGTSFGTDGTSATTFSGLNTIGYQQANKRLYALANSSIYGFSNPTPGSFAPLGGAFPFAVGGSSTDTDMAVDNTLGASANHLFWTPDGQEIRGFDAAGSPLSGFPIAPGVETCGIAVDNAGNIWGGRYGNETAGQWGPSGGALLQSVPVGSAVGRPCKIAVDSSTNDVYVSQFGNATVAKFTAASGYTSFLQLSPIDSGNSRVAVNGTRHVVYVGGPSSNKVRTFATSDGSLVETLTAASNVKGLAVQESTDTVFVSLSNGKIQEFPGVKVAKATTGEPTGNSSVSGMADPDGAGTITECFFEYGLSATEPPYGSTQNCEESLPISSPQTVHATLPGLTNEETYHYRLVLGNGVGLGKGLDRTIIPHAVHGIKTEPASALANMSATLNGSFEGTGEDTHYSFEWGRTNAYGHQSPIPPEDAGVTSGPTAVHFNLGGLLPGTVYHYRVVGTNGLGTSKGLDETFKTREPPTVEGFLSTEVTASSATLVARVNPAGEETNYYFEYGTTPEYGAVVPVPTGILPAGTTTETVEAPITGLGSSTYHFRFVAESKWGVTSTGDQTFNFYPESCPNAHLRQQTGAGFLPDCRAYELVSPENAGSLVLSNRAPTSANAENPPRFSFSGKFGAIAGAGDPQATFSDVYITTRTSQGWETRYVGIRGNEGAEAQGPPNVGGEGEGVYVSQSMDKLLDWDTGQQGFACCGKKGSYAPYMWDYSGEPLGRLPTNLGEIPNGTADVTQGGFFGDVKPSPDFSHYFFSSNNVAFAAEGLTTGPGSAYDNDLTTNTVSLISKTPQGDPIPKDAGNSAEYIKFPGVSTDGSHILMSTLAAGGGTHLYMRVGGGSGVTYDVSIGQDSLNHGVTFQGMTADGKMVYFTSPEKLTADDHDTGIDLFRWQEDPTPTVIKVSTGTGGGDSDSCGASWIGKCGVEGIKLTRLNQFGEPLLNVTDNAVASEQGGIYFYSPELLDADRGTPGERNLYTFREGEAQYVATFTGSNLVTRIQVSPDGHHAAFVTGAKLTSYNNAGFLEMYSYDSLSRSLLCVSCIPNGSKPTANVEASINGRFMSDDGRTFFATTNGLVDRDANGLWDVYEYVDSRPQLISSGTANQDKGGLSQHAGLLGVSASGTDVYFSTLETLVGQDRNGAFYKFYDARTNGGFPFVPPQAPCAAADECHGPGSSAPPSPATGTTAYLGDGGNARPAQTKKKRVKKRHKKHRRHAQHGGRRK